MEVIRDVEGEVHASKFQSFNEPWRPSHLIGLEIRTFQGKPSFPHFRLFSRLISTTPTKPSMRRASCI